MRACTLNKTCIVCESVLPCGEFRKVGRGYSKTCRTCENGEQPATEPATEPGPMLAIKPGFELRVWVDDDGDLVIAQEREEFESRVYLAPHQVPQLAQFLNPVKEATL
jgi:hypothetical protein